MFAYLVILCEGLVVGNVFPDLSVALGVSGGGLVGCTGGLGNIVFFEPTVKHHLDIHLS